MSRCVAALLCFVFTHGSLQRTTILHSFLPKSSLLFSTRDDVEVCRSSHKFLLHFMNRIHGNVRSGAPPPWFDTTNGSHLDAVNIKTKTKKSNLNPKRVGVTWAEKRKIEMEMEHEGDGNNIIIDQSLKRIQYSIRSMKHPRDSHTPVSVPLPLLIRGSTPRTSIQSSETKLTDNAAANLYGDDWTLLIHDLLCDVANGLLWKISLDLETISTRKTEVPAVLEFLQRRELDVKKRGCLRGMSDMLNLDCLLRIRLNAIGCFAKASIHSSRVGVAFYNELFCCGGSGEKR